MNAKKVLTISVAIAVLTASLAGCTVKDSTATEQTVVVTQEVTDAKGESVTDKAGEVVTEVVTDKNGEAVTKEATTTTKAGESTTAKGDVTTTAAKGKKQSTTAAKSTTNSGKTTKPKSVSKAATTQGTTTKLDNYVQIQLTGTCDVKCTSPNVTISKQNSRGTVYIEKGGDYIIKGSSKTWHGQIIIKLKNTEKCNIRFEGTGKIESDSKNIIQIIDTSINTDRSFLEAEAAADTAAEDALATVADNDMAPNVDLSFPTGSNWTIQSSANSYTGVIYNESKLTIQGNGRATIASVKNANNCICSTKSITIKNVALSLSTAQNNNTESLAKTTGSAKGIFSYSKVYVESGSLNIKSNGDGIRCDRFYAKGGTINITSSACDAIDTDDSITISAGTIKAIAYQKYSFKVRRVNNTENAAVKGKVRADKADGFWINGGTVTGESKNISTLVKTYQSAKKDSSQASITAKIVKKNTDELSKTPAVISISGVGKTSAAPCIKYIYSSSAVSTGKSYTASAKNGNSAKVVFTGKAGVADIKTTSNK